MFLGSFCGDDTSVIPTCTNTQSITKLKFSNGIYDELYGSTNADLDQSKLEWDFNTQFYAKFQDNLYAGNVNYTSDLVSSMRIKRRKQGEHKWFVLHNVEINSDEDFSFEYIDKYAQGSTEYDYAIVPVMSGIEGNINKNTIVSEFANYFILDQDVTYPIIVNTNLVTQLNKNTGVITTLGKKYPFIISNGYSQYVTGSFKFSLIPIDCNSLSYTNEQDNYNYTKQFNDWIMNGKPKILKDWTGQIYMINVTNSIPIDYSAYQLPSYEVQFTEIGDVFDQDDMYNNNFTNTNFSLSSAYE